MINLIVTLVYCIVAVLFIIIGVVEKILQTLLAILVIKLKNIMKGAKNDGDKNI